MARDYRPTIYPFGPDSGLILDGEAAHLREGAAQSRGKVLLCAHIGSSMNPTLDASDLLEVRPYGDRMPNVGDVILFLPAGRETAVVHRVVGISPPGIRCRGDGNREDDPWLLQPTDVIGQVVAAQRGKRRRRVAGGGRGLLRAIVARWQRRLDRKLSALMHPLYRSIARSGVLRRITPARLRPRMVVFEGGEEQIIRLMIGQRIVGHLDRRTGRWRIRRPFRLLADEDMTP